MLKITVISVGGMKESYFAEAIAEYEKRAGAYAEMKNINLKEAPLAATRAGDIAAALDAEGEQILKHLPPRACKIALCVEGRQLSSEELSELIYDLPCRGYSKICFVIGPFDGLPEEVKRACDMRLSFSKMTFPHQLMRVILLEQIYRAGNIASGGKYHH